MKIKSIRFFGFQQFQDTFLDFTHPETGEPLDQICLIGKNGTGKSTVLKLLTNFLSNGIEYRENFKNKGVIIFEWQFQDKEIISLLVTDNINSQNYLRVYKNEIDIKKIVLEAYDFKSNGGSFFDYFSKNFSGYFGGLDKDSKLKFNSNDILMHTPADSEVNSYLSISNVPDTNFSQALEYGNNIPYYNEVSPAKSAEFWRTLIYNIKKREADKEIFENLPENLQKTKQQLLDEFNKNNPKILDEISELWNRILEPTGLYFDVQGASVPIQLNDNLLAYIKVKATGEVIQYNQLSSGIRNFIFKLGHILSLYFNREIDRGFLFVDEPENSLFPDFLYGLIDVYSEITTDKRGQNNTQRFFATHNPIIAAQFQPYERIILDWDEKGTVVANKGIAPIGDDPNDLLKKDFQVRSLMGKEGEEKFKEYLHLRKQLRAAQSPEDKMELASKMSEIGREYEFEG